MSSTTDKIFCYSAHDVFHIMQITTE